MLKFIGKTSHNKFKEKILTHLNSLSTFFIAFMCLTPLIYVLFHFGYINPANYTSPINPADVSDVFSPTFNDTDFDYVTKYDRVAHLIIPDGGRCSAFLVNHYTLLTAAHCVCEGWGEGDYETGEIANWNDCSDIVELNFTQVIDDLGDPLPGYQNIPAQVSYVSDNANDYALLNIDANLGIKPFRMAMSYDEKIDPREAYIIGYGQDLNEEHFQQERQNYIERYKMDKNPSFIQLQQPVTKGDSGGPLLVDITVLGDDGEEYLEQQIIGIVSHRIWSAPQQQEFLDSRFWTQARYDEYIPFAEKAFAQKVVLISTNPQIPNSVWDYRPQ